MQEILLNVHGFRIVRDGCGNGTVESDLLGNESRNEELDDRMENRSSVEDALFVAAANALESLVLACACEGIDVAAPPFQRALETACDAVGNEYGV